MPLETFKFQSLLTAGIEIDLVYSRRLEISLIKLFEAIRAACTPDVWSKGITISRAGGVVGDFESSSEVVVRVMAPGQGVSPTVRLFPDDEDWFCDCGSKLAACAHAAASIISMKRAFEEGKSLVSTDTKAGRMTYQFERESDGLKLCRFVLRGTSKTPFKGTLSAQSGFGSSGLGEIAASSADLEIDSVLARLDKRLIPSAFMRKILQMLENSNSEVAFEETSIRIGANILKPSVAVIDVSGGLALRWLGIKDVNPDYCFPGSGACLDKGILYPVSHALPGVKEKGWLAQDIYNQRHFANLVSEIIPSLREKYHVELQSRTLPEAVRLEPRIVILTRGEGEIFSLVPKVVYGDPAIAEVSADGQLILYGNMVPLRDVEEEKILSRQFERKYDWEVNCPRAHVTDDAIQLAISFEQQGVPAYDSNLAQIIYAGPLKAQLEFDGNKPKLRFSTSLDFGSYPQVINGVRPTTVIDAWNNKQRYIKLLDGSWAELPLDWLAVNKSALLRLVKAESNPENLSPINCLEICNYAEEMFGMEAPDEIRIRAKLLVDQELTELPHSAKQLDASLRDYQRQGVLWLSTRKKFGLGAMLADDMGLGKTLQTAAVISKDEKTLVIMPTSLLHNWKSELERFRPDLAVSTYHGKERAISPNADVVLTTYGMLRNDTNSLGSVKWDCVVLDESQTIKNRASQTFKSLSKVDGTFRVALTGTPIENSLEDIWSQFYFLNPGLLGTPEEFARTFSDPLRNGDNAAASALTRLIGRLILRRKKQDVAKELPPKTESVLYCNLSKAENEIYQTILAATRKDIVEKLGEGGGVIQLLEALLRLRQASSDASLIPGSRFNGLSAKLNLLLDRVSEGHLSGHKMLIFSQWTSLLDRIESALGVVDGLKYLRLDGTTRDRKAVVSQFQEDGQISVLLMSLKAGGVGLNLTAADHVFLVDPWWNPMAEDQAADRAHRIGQQKPVFIYRLVAEGTIEERILDLQKRKRMLADSLFEGGSASISRDEILEIIG